MRAEAVKRLAPLNQRRVVTVHDGYSYMLQELGIELVGVVEPAHGLVPSAAELGEIVALVRKQRVRVVLAEERFPAPLLDVLREAGAEVTTISHIATGAFTPERFEVEMLANVTALIEALESDDRRR